jgi:hypothetical protein
MAGAPGQLAYEERERKKRTKRILYDGNGD